MHMTMIASQPPLQDFPIGCLEMKISTKYGESVSRDAVAAFRYDELGGMANFIASTINPASDPLRIYADLVKWSAECLESEGFFSQ